MQTSTLKVGPGAVFTNFVWARIVTVVLPDNGSQGVTVIIDVTIVPFQLADTVTGVGADT